MHQLHTDRKLIIQNATEMCMKIGKIALLILNILYIVNCGGILFMHLKTIFKNGQCYKMIKTQQSCDSIFYSVCVADLLKVCIIIKKNFRWTRIKEKKHCKCTCCPGSDPISGQSEFFLCFLQELPLSKNMQLIG